MSMSFWHVTTLNTNANVHLLQQYEALPNNFPMS